jgi:hypothetical protein
MGWSCEGDGWVNWSGLATLLAEASEALAARLASLLAGALGKDHSMAKPSR